MSKLVYDFFHNYVLIVGLISWFAAQLIKSILVLIETKKFRWERMIGSGGMPSSHSSTVCGVVVAMARSSGVSSPLFALAFIFAAVVMHDAMGVRLEAGKHARIINVLLKKVDMKDLTEEKDLKELLGHTTLQVVAGAVLGIVIALIIPVF
ncbi:divergent PAP2 family protein [Massiliimalia massiliensis]|uniref:divergent PAP2 family protein n=1 Tax=Massiliimalia massiliensis TaxID=1852384 RepID=UPI00098725A7|nr:divergent PAP2 family protein [Massiliimalia massiliensis]